MSFWVILDDSIDTDELLAGAGAAALGAFLAELVAYQGNPCVSARTQAKEGARRSLLIGGHSVAPTRFVLGLDSDRDVMVVHELATREQETIG